jgi:F-type H+-transporting ATPase subunit alpha
VTAYIPTNVISITDGQIYLEGDLFYAGVRPAVNVGISVSRVGGSAQTKAMRKVAGRLRLDLAQFRELEAFAQFASDLDKATQAQLARGERQVEILKQGLFRPWPMEEQVSVLYAAGQGYFDDVELPYVKDCEAKFADYMRSSGKEVLTEIATTKLLTDETEEKLKAAIKAFKTGYAPPAAADAAGGGEAAPAADEAAEEGAEG